MVTPVKTSAEQSSRETYTIEVPKTADADRAVFLGNPLVDNLLTAVTALSAELWSMRRRMKVMERVLEEHDVMTRDMLEKYVPTAAELAVWDAERDAFVKLVFDSFARPADIPYTASLHPSNKD